MSSAVNASKKVEDSVEGLEEGKNEGETKTSDEGKQQESIKTTVAYILTRNVSDNLLPYFGMLAMAIVQCIAVGAFENKDAMHIYGLVLSIVTIALSVVALIIILMERQNHKKDQSEFYGEDHVVPGYPIIMKLLSYFLLLWNFVGTCLMTFGSLAPFDITGNGYFGSWGVVVFSIMAVGITMDTIKGTFRGLNFQIGLLMCCFLVFFDSVGIVADKKFCVEVVGVPTCFNHVVGSLQWNIALFAFILSILTAILVPLFLYLEHKKVEQLKTFKSPTLVIFAIVWFVEAILATFSGPFLYTGNGYFGSWGGAVTSILVAKYAAPEGTNEAA